MSEAPDFWNLHARKLDPSLSEDWQWMHLECLDGQGPTIVRMKGSVCRVKYKSGARKGEENWDKRDRTTERVFNIPMNDHRTFVEEWERTTGLCQHCGDTGVEFDSWNHKTGRATRPCRCPQGKR